MTYFKSTDPVITPAGHAIFWGYWPDRTMGKVRLEDGRFRSFAVADIKPLSVAIVDAVTAAGFESVEAARP